MSYTVEDPRGQQVGVGDTIAYAVTVGRSGNLRIGKIVEIVWAHPSFERWDKEKKYPNTVPTKLRVQVETSAFGSLYSDKPTLIEAGFKRFVKLSSPPPPPFGAIPKTRDEMAAFAKAWDAKVEASWAKRAND